MTVDQLKNQKLKAWIQECVTMCQPDSVEVILGDKPTYDKMIQLTVDAGLAITLDQQKRPGCYLYRSDPSDVARVESRTFISSTSQDDAGPTNNWKAPAELKAEMSKLYTGSMKGRVMYVIPYSMGPVGSNIAKIGVEITDSPYVVINMYIMTRVGQRVLDVLGADGAFVPCLHSVGFPLAPGQKDNGKWPCAPIEHKYISHFPEERLVWSYGSGYGGNALLGKKCLALRIASVLARDEGWLAEHMLILKITNPEGKSKFICAAFPSACGKTNLAMLVPTIPNWKVETVGDDISWMKYGPDGRLYAINPEAGFFGVAPGTSMKSNPNALLSCRTNTIFTNVALTADNDVWWEGIGYDAPGELIDWQNNKWTPGVSKTPAAHPNSRFTAPASQCPVIANEWEDPKGVPISAILFGGRRPSTIPLVHQSTDWAHGVFMGSIVGSEITAAAVDLKVGDVRRDPFAMLPFCGYHMGDYFKHWIDVGKASTPDKLPKIFMVNWFRKAADGKWLWPGYGDNSRVLAWVFDRCDGTGKAEQTPIGFIPTIDAIQRPDEVTEAQMKELLSVDIAGWKKELQDVKEKHYPKFGAKLPQELAQTLERIQASLN